MMTQISGDFLKATSAKIGDAVYVVSKLDNGQYRMYLDTIEQLDFSHGNETNPVFAGTTASNVRFTLVDKTGEIPVTTNKICQIFRDADKVRDFLNAEREELEAAYFARIESITAISQGLRKA